MFRSTLLAVAGLLICASLVAAQGPPRRGMGGPRQGMPPCCAAMMGDVKAMDARLDEKLAAVNAATGEAKIDAMAAVVNELVSQRRAMHEKMASMSAGPGCPAGCPMCPMAQ